MKLERLIRPTCKGLYKEVIGTGKVMRPIRSLKIRSIKSFFRKKHYLAINLNVECRHEGKPYMTQLIDNLISSLNIKEIKREWVEDGEYYGVIIKIKRVT